jgi:hypothetical protein
MKSATLELIRYFMVGMVKVSVELMALGKPVLCYIDPDLMQYRPDLPIVNVTPASFNSRTGKPDSE